MHVPAGAHFGSIESGEKEDSIRVASLPGMLFSFMCVTVHGLQRIGECFYFLPVGTLDTSTIRLIEFVPGNRCAAIVASGIDSVSLPVMLEPLPGTVRIEGFAEAGKLVFNQRIHWINNQCADSCFPLLMTPLGNSVRTLHPVAFIVAGILPLAVVPPVVNTGVWRIRGFPSGRLACKVGK